MSTVNDREFSRRHTGGPDDRRWLYVPYDQLSHRLGPLAREAPETLGIVLIESRCQAQRRPYHKQKLALLLANMRHFALEQVARGRAGQVRRDRQTMRRGAERVPGRHRQAARDGAWLPTDVTVDPAGDNHTRD